MNSTGPASRPQQDNDPAGDLQLSHVPVVHGYKVLDPCILFRRIGKGGMGTVYHAKHMNLNVDAAVKVMHPDLARNEEYLSRFKGEASTAAVIQHHNVVRVFDVRESQGLHYIVMEFVDGEHTRDRVVRKGALDIQEAIHIALGAGRGLAAAHRIGTVHRDIKPDNILVSTAGDVKLADLGLAKPQRTDDDPGMTRTMAVLGTPQYMPPEQWHGVSEVRFPGDVWALGATLYFLLTGEDGIPRGSYAEICTWVLNKSYPDPRQKRPEIPDGLAELIADCTRTDPADRPATAAEFVRRLEPFADRSASNLLADEQLKITDSRTLISPPPLGTVVSIRTQVEQQSQIEGQAGEPTLIHDPGTLQTVLPSGVTAPLGTLPTIAQAPVRRAGDPNLAGSEGPAPVQPRRSFWKPVLALCVTAVAVAFAFPEVRATLFPSPSARARFDLSGEWQNGATYTSDLDYKLLGRVKDPEATSLLYSIDDGEPKLGAIQADRTFRISLELHPNRAQRVSLGTVGGRASTTVTIHHDDVVPQVEPRLGPEPLGAPILASSGLELEFRVLDQTALVTVTGGEFDEPLELKPTLENPILRRTPALRPADGEVTYEIQAEDAAGNRPSPLSMTFLVDRTLPELLLKSPGGNSLLRSGENLIALEFSEPIAWIEIDGQRALVEGLRHEFTVDVPRGETEWTVPLAFQDLLGNRVDDSLVYGVALDPVFVTELQLEPGSGSIPEGPIQLTGTAEGVEGEQLLAHWISFADGEQVRFDAGPVVLGAGGRIQTSFELPASLPDGLFRLQIAGRNGGADWSSPVGPVLDRTTPALVTEQGQLGSPVVPLRPDPEAGDFQLELVFSEVIRLTSEDLPEQHFADLAKGSDRGVLSLPVADLALSFDERRTLSFTATDAVGRSTAFQVELSAPEPPPKWAYLESASFPPVVDWLPESQQFVFLDTNGKPAFFGLPKGFEIAELEPEPGGAQPFELTHRASGDVAEMILVPVGSLLGPKPREGCSEPFLIDRYELSQERFARTGVELRYPVDEPSSELAQANVSYQNARSGLMKLGRSLPSVEAWETAAGWDGHSFPEVGLEQLELQKDRVHGANEPILLKSLQFDESPLGIYGMRTGLREHCLSQATMRTALRGGHSFAFGRNNPLDATMVTSQFTSMRRQIGVRGLVALKPSPPPP